MMRRLSAALAGLVLLAAAAPPARDWSTATSRTADGAPVIGNPAARVKLAEYVSYTCPHCAKFVADSHDGLGAMVRSGSVGIEVRNVIFNPLDLAASLTARCAGGRFAAVHAALFAKQDGWYARFAEWEPVNRSRVALYPEQDRLKAYADGAGLTALAEAQGVPGAALARCQGDPAELAALLRVAAAASPKVKGTPTFEVNGRLVENVLWSALEPMLRAAGARAS